MPTVASFNYAPLLKEVASTDGFVRKAPTKWVRVTVTMDSGVVYVVDAKKKHFRRLPSTEQVAQCQS